MSRVPILMGNWKMYKTVPESLAFAGHLVQTLSQLGWPTDRQLVVAPTALALWPLSEMLASTPLALAAQNLELGAEGAMTGALSGHLLKAAGAKWVLVGHSERRQHFGESDQLVAAKALAAVEAGLIPVVCVGESEMQHREGHTRTVLARQLAPVLAMVPETLRMSLVVAYEPVWAIGTDRTPTLEDIDGISRSLRHWLVDAWGATGQTIRILYGGSVRPANLRDIWHLPEVDGALVGGASLSGLFAEMATVPLAKRGLQS